MLDVWIHAKWTVYDRGLALYVADVFASLRRKDQRAKSDCCLRGLMLDGRRKSIQAMAARLPDGNEQNLQQFVNQSTGTRGGAASDLRTHAAAHRPDGLGDRRRVAAQGRKNVSRGGSAVLRSPGQTR